jgi:hypothetical protein
LLAKLMGTAGVGYARILASIALLVATAVVARGALGFSLPAISRPAAFLTILSGIGGAISWFCASSLNSWPGVIAGAAAGGIVFLVCTLLADGPLSLGVRESLGMFFPALARKSQA